MVDGPHHGRPLRHGADRHRHGVGLRRHPYVGVAYAVVPCVEAACGVVAYAVVACAGPACAVAVYVVVACVVVEKYGVAPRAAAHAVPYLAAWPCLPAMYAYGCWLLYV